MAKIVYTADEVARHDNINDLWVVMNRKVYDLTRFVKEHPGGEEVLLEVAGSDGTKCFDSIGHSEEAKLRRKIYMIGELAEGETASKKVNQLEKKAEKKEPTIDNDDWQYEEVKEKKSYYLPLFIGIAVVVYAIIIKYLW
ncbi:hypothetical protein DMN91_006078 [Ooceraea biroi]|uniref:Cytochrome b5 heme-binding domain-containing protein n=1 Tax=Ooceraea biroi TaxID=2015173 RepID=A0A3L8DNA8_OOCBI|nr:cytochrome b5 [Ooceraea biroi]RLU21702.1 hypothetical protein DMN91_006078 [Ooceraea biroi]